MTKYHGGKKLIFTCSQCGKKYTTDNIQYLPYQCNECLEKFWVGRGNKLTYICPECGEKWTTHIIQGKPYTCPKCLRKILKELQR